MGNVIQSSNNWGIQDTEEPQRVEAKRKKNNAFSLNEIIMQTENSF